MFSCKLEIYLQCPCFLKNGTSMICYKKNETDYFSYFSKPCWSLGGFSYRASCSPPYLHPFSDFTFEEMVGVEEPAHGEAPPEGNLNSEENM